MAAYSGTPPTTSSRFPDRETPRPDWRAALTLRLMTNTALTGATHDIDGGRQLALMRRFRHRPGAYLGLEVAGLDLAPAKRWERRQSGSMV
jgi:hypothetical protein